MSQQRRRRASIAVVSRRVGEPNVLSDQAVPNQLSTMGPPASAAGARRSPRPSPPPSSTPMRRTGGFTPATPPADAAPRARRLPSLGTILFIGFLLLTIFRFIENALSSGR